MNLHIWVFTHRVPFVGHYTINQWECQKCHMLFRSMEKPPPTALDGLMRSCDDRILKAVMES